MNAGLLFRQWFPQREDPDYLAGSVLNMLSEVGVTLGAFRYMVADNLYLGVQSYLGLTNIGGHSPLSRYTSRRIWPEVSNRNLMVSLTYQLQSIVD